MYIYHLSGIPHSHAYVASLPSPTLFAETRAAVQNDVPLVKPCCNDKNCHGNTWLPTSPVHSVDSILERSKTGSSSLRYELITGQGQLWYKPKSYLERKSDGYRGCKVKEVGSGERPTLSDEENNNGRDLMHSPHRRSPNVRSPNIRSPNSRSPNTRSPEHSEDDNNSKRTPLDMLIRLFPKHPPAVLQTVLIDCLGDLVVAIERVLDRYPNSMSKSEIMHQMASKASPELESQNSMKMPELRVSRDYEMIERKYQSSKADDHLSTLAKAYDIPVVVDKIEGRHKSEPNWDSLR